MKIQAITCCVILFFSFANAQDTAQCHADSCVSKIGKETFDDQHDKVEMLQSGISLHHNIAFDEGTEETQMEASAKPEPEPEPEPESEPEAEMAKNSQFLITATFGPTKKTLAEKSKMKYSAWIDKQFSLPPSSHREYYRKRTNPYLSSSQFPVRDVCAKGSRWSNTVFTLNDALGKARVTVSNGDVLVNGKKRTSINPATPVKQCSDTAPPGKRFLGGQSCKAHKLLNTQPWRYCRRGDWRSNKWCQQTCFDRMSASNRFSITGDDCSGGWANKTTFSSRLCPEFFNERPGAMIMFSTDGRCGHTRRRAVPAIRMPQLAAWDAGGAPTLNATLFDTSQHVGGSVLFLAADQQKQSTVCTHLKTGIIKVGSRVLVPEARYVLAANTPSNPIQGRPGLCAPRTFVNNGACAIGDTNSACPVTCGSHGEVANDPMQGHLFPINTKPHVDRRRRRNVRDFSYMLDTRRNIPGNLAKSVVWTEIVLNAEDQLRQRIAWALSQIIVVGISGFPAAEQETEPWVYFYDIMVRNAFGNFKDILREVTYSPVMATYLTYLNSESFDSKKSAPDENYAREIMQLFTIGLSKLDKNGAKIKDGKNMSVPTYTPQHIVDFARVFTGFTERSSRANIEASRGNRIDPLVMDSTFHDRYPKPDLNNGYIGDRYPLCMDLPKDAFLQKGATYEYMGSKNYFYTPRTKYIARGYCRDGYYSGWNRNDAKDVATCAAKCKSETNCRFFAIYVGRTCSRYDNRANDCKNFRGHGRYKLYKLERGPEGSVLQAQNSSGLSAALSSTPPQASVTLGQKINCAGTECNADAVDIVAAGDNLYAFVKPSCVYSFFMPTQKEIDCGSTQPSGSQFCCTPGTAPAPVTGIKEEQFYFNQGCRLPNLSGRKPSKVRTVQSVRYSVRRRRRYRTFSGFTSNREFAARWTGRVVIKNTGMYTFSLYSDDGSRLIMDGTTVVNNDGCHGYRKRSGRKQLASGAHGLEVKFFQNRGGTAIAFRYSGPDTANKETDVRDFQIGPPTCPRPVTVDVTLLPGGKVTSNVPANSFPVSWDGPAPAVAKDTRVAAQIQEIKVFSQVPTVADLQQLMTGAFAPSVNCSHSCSGPVKGYAADGATIDEKTVFEYNGVFLKNSKSQVLVNGTAFRNPPAFLHPHIALGKHEQDVAADAEVLGVIDHLLYHQNTPLTLARKVIQRLTMSNPPLPYLQSVAAAFSTGKFMGKTYSGRYGDLGAMVAAIILHPAARTNNRTTSGALREPMLKIIHFMRSMGYMDKLSEPIVFSEFVAKIGQFPYYSPTVFNYFEADYMPMNFGMMPGKMGPEPEPEPEPEAEPEPESEPEPLVAPEFQILIPPFIINLLNGMKSLTKYGVSPCSGGLGQDANRRRRNDCWQGYLSGTKTLDELDILLTGGRLTRHHAGTLRAVWDNAIYHNQWPEQAAKQAMLLMPEFHNLGDPLSNGIRGPAPAPPPTKPAVYKALVMVFLGGGADTFNMLVPRDCPLHQSYKAARKGCDIAMSTLLPIQADTQDCKKFGIHPSMPQLKNLYVAKEAAFISNIGALSAPSTRFNLRGRCPNQGSHSHGQVAAQTLNCLGLGLATGSGGGVAGKLADELATTNMFKASSFSLSGKPAWSESIRTKAEILDGRSGVIRLEGYSDWKDTIANITMEKLGNVFAEEYTIAFKDAVNSSETFSKFLNNAQYNPPNYPTPSGLSRQLRQVAKLIATRTKREAERDFFWTSIGGWDMHSNVNVNLPRNLGAVDEAVSTFVKEMKRQQVFDNTVLITASDFGRTLTYNGAGTDHAWAGNHIIVGGSVNGGVIYNEFLKGYKRDSTNDQVMDGRGRVVPKFPWDNMMVPIAKWLGVSENSLNKIFPNLPKFNRSSHIISESVLFNASKVPAPPPPGSGGSGSGSGSGSR